MQWSRQLGMGVGDNGAEPLHGGLPTAAQPWCPLSNLEGRSLLPCAGGRVPGDPQYMCSE